MTDQAYIHAHATMDRHFGLGVEQAHEILRRSPEAKRIYDCAVNALVEAQQGGPFVTLEQAKKIVEARSNGGLEGTSASKGGRAWIEGEWCLAELEGLCVMLRHEAGAAAEGAVEVLAIWKGMEETDEAR